MRRLLVSELLVYALAIGWGSSGISQSSPASATLRTGTQESHAMIAASSAIPGTGLRPGLPAATASGMVLSQRTVLSQILSAGLVAAEKQASVAADQQTSSAANPVGNSVAGFDPLTSSRPALNPLTEPTITPGVLQLLELEAKFADDVAANGGKAFGNWFAEDAVALSNGRSPVIGRAAIAAEAQWDPKQYQLTWVAQGARMGPSTDMGFTWGHYDSTARDAHGETVKTSGRYMTIWKKMQDGSWKVELDSSAEEPPDPGSCCALPKP